jgi:hypothetical protein
MYSRALVCQEPAGAYMVKRHWSRFVQSLLTPQFADPHHYAPEAVQ